MKIFIQRKEIYMKNKLTDLNNHLFSQLERLNDEDMSEEELNSEIKKAKAISDIADKIISNASLSLEAEKLKFEIGADRVNMPEMLRLKEK